MCQQFDPCIFLYSAKHQRVAPRKHQLLRTKHNYKEFVFPFTFGAATITKSNKLKYRKLNKKKSKSHSHTVLSNDNNNLNYFIDDKCEQGVVCTIAKLSCLDENRKRTTIHLNNKRRLHEERANRES